MEFSTLNDSAFMIRAFRFEFVFVPPCDDTWNLRIKSAIWTLENDPVGAVCKLAFVLV
eukprot:m.237949 g.237949  ORF g.237949 m.237949 type:complete len:58 (+) comp15280_c3_seq2:523-696(+)